MFLIINMRSACWRGVAVALRSGGSSPRAGRTFTSGTAAAVPQLRSGGAATSRLSPPRRGAAAGAGGPLAFKVSRAAYDDTFDAATSAARRDEFWLGVARNEIEWYVGRAVARGGLAPQLLTLSGERTRRARIVGGRAAARGGRAAQLLTPIR